MRCLLGIHFEDTQCGGKILPAQGYRQVAGLLKERGYIFDPELLLALERQGGCNIVEQRVPWREMAGGKVYPLRDAWPMLAGIHRIRKRLKAGLYFDVE